MKITILKNKIKDTYTTHSGIEIVKQRLASINFPVEIKEVVTGRTFTTQYFTNTTIGQGACVRPEEILQEVDGNDDVAFLIFDNTGMNPKPVNPCQSPLKKGKTTPCQMCEQWYNGYPEVFADFFLHEICHSMYFLLNRVSEDKTHNQGLNPGWQNKQNYEWYLHLIQEMMPAWKIYDKQVVRVLRLGMKGEDVKDLQSDLNRILGTNLVVDGDFGMKTKNAVVRFQKENGLVADGVVGSKTREEMAKKKL